MVINEASLIAYLDCDEMIKCEALYHYQNNVYIVLELMEHGSMTNIVTKYNR